MGWHSILTSPWIESSDKYLPNGQFSSYHLSIFEENNSFNQELTQSLEPYANTMVQVFHLFDQGKFGDGKFCWLQQFIARFDFVNQVTVDVWGNEDDLFVSLLEAILQTTFQSHCSSPNCPNPNLNVSSKRITLR